MKLRAAGIVGSGELRRFLFNVLFFTSKTIYHYSLETAVEPCVTRCGHMFCQTHLSNVSWVPQKMCCYGVAENFFRLTVAFDSAIMSRLWELVYSFRGPCSIFRKGTAIASIYTFHRTTVAAISVSNSVTPLRWYQYGWNCFWRLHNIIQSCYSRTRITWWSQTFAIRHVCPLCRSHFTRPRPGHLIGCIITWRFFLLFNQAINILTTLYDFIWRYCRSHSCMDCSYIETFLHFLLLLNSLALEYFNWPGEYLQALLLVRPEASQSHP